MKKRFVREKSPANLFFCGKIRRFYEVKKSCAASDGYRITALQKDLASSFCFRVFPCVLWGIPTCPP
jgi:hypothetical protein